MTVKKRTFKSGARLFPDDVALEGLEGELKAGATSQKLETHIEGADRELLTNDQTQTVENKTVDGTAATGNNTVKADASDITFDPTTSGLSAVTSQAAIDEVEGRLDTAESDITTNATSISDHLADAVDAHDASAISNVASGNLAATDVQGALNELQSDIDTRALDSALTDHLNDATDAHDASAVSLLDTAAIFTATEVETALNEVKVIADGNVTDIGTNATAISDHLADTVDAHDASAVSLLDTAAIFTATEVETALNEVKVIADANATGISDHLADAADAHDASAISNVPAGNLAATDIQGAVNELQTDIDTRALDSDLTTHMSDTTTHGVTTAIVGVDDVQTLTQKTITGASIQTPSRSDVKQDTEANLTTYASSATNGQMCFATDTKKMYQIVDAALVAVGSGGGGSLDFFYTEDFEETAAADLTVTGTWTKADNEATQISGDRSIKMTQASGSATAQVTAGNIALDLNQKDTTISLQGRYTYDGDNNDIDFVIYDVTNTTVLSRTSLPASSAAKTFRVLANTASTTANIKWYFEVMTENIGAILEFDNIEGRVNPLATIESVESEIVVYSGYTSRNGSNQHLLALEEKNTSSGLISVTNTDHTRYTFLKEVDFVANFNYLGTAESNTRLYLYNSSDVQQLVVAQETGGSGIGNATMIFKASIGDYIVASNASGGTDNDSHSFSVTAQATSANVVFEGAPTDTEWTDFTPTGTFTNTTFTGKYRRVGDSAEVRVRAAVTGTPVGTLTIDTPNGLVIDTAKLNSTTAFHDVLGHLSVHDNGTAVYTGTVVYNTTTNVSCFSADATGSFNIAPLVPITFVSGDSVSISYTVPIEGWSVADPLLSVPVTNEVENVYSARIDGISATPAVKTESSKFISSITDNSAGDYTINFVSGMFTTVPSVVANMIASDSDMSTTVVSVSTSSVTIRTEVNVGGANIDRDFDLVVQRQGADYKHPKGYFLGNMARSVSITSGTEYDTGKIRFGSRVYAVDLDLTVSLSTGVTATLYTTATGLTPVSLDGMFKENSSGVWYSFHSNASATASQWLSYDPSTGVISARTNGFGTIGEERITFEYTK